MATVSVLICTHRRLERLAQLLDDIAHQLRPPDEVVVVENEQVATAEGIVAAFASRVAFPVHYSTQPRKNNSLTRNQSVRVAAGEWLAFVDPASAGTREIAPLTT